MGFDIHTITMPPGAGPQLLDRLIVGSFLSVPYGAAANSLGSVGAVTAGSAYTATPVITPTGGVLNAAAPASGNQAAGGWAAILRATLKVVGTPAIEAAGSGWVTNDTATFANGVVLTVTASAGAATSWAVTTAGSFVGPGGVPVGAQAPISTSGVGIGATVTFSWGLNTVLIDDSGNYSTIPTGFTVTNAVGDTTGTGGAVAAGAATATGAAVFRAVLFGAPLPYGVIAMINASPANDEIALNAKLWNYASMKIQPAVVANTVVAGAFDAIAWA